jgi:adenylate cyclase
MMLNPSELQKITVWLIDGARSAVSPSHMMKETCERLVQAGLPLWRVGVFVQTLHPGIFGVSFVWRPGAEVVIDSADSDPRNSPQFKNSPLSILYEKEQEVRYRLDDPESRRFPFFDDMRVEGVTDYIALPLRFTSRSIHASSWTT